MRRSGPDQIERARAAWGDAPPPEILALARACKAETSRAVSRRLGVSDSLVSQALGKRYPSDLSALFAQIRDVYLNDTVACPVFQMEIGRSRCETEQSRPFSAGSAIRAQLFHGCKICPNRRRAAAGPDSGAARSEA